MAGGDGRRRRTEGVVAAPRRLLSCLFLLGALFGLASAATRPRRDLRCQFISSGCVGNRMVSVDVTNDGGETLVGTIFPAAVQGNWNTVVAVANDSLVVTTASCTATYPERAPLMGFLYPLNFQAQRPKGDGATRFNLSVMSASGLHGATRTGSSPQSAPPPPAADNSSHQVAAELNTDHLFDHLQYSSNNGLEVAAVTTTMIAVLIDLAEKKRRGRGRGSPAAVVAMALVMLLAVAALVNPTAAARPLYGGGGAGGHDEAAAAAAAPAMTVAVVNDAVTVTGHSGCTNDPNTLEPWRCVHH
uniref:Uncharacterized protein n=1 Tax=Oryza nivara TaxID=4536 RepID=A0A0E0IIF7_ORYNI